MEKIFQGLKIKYLQTWEEFINVTVFFPQKLTKTTDGYSYFPTRLSIFVSSSYIYYLLSGKIIASIVTVK
jgi:hypothetical protein